MTSLQRFMLCALVGAALAGCTRNEEPPGQPQQPQQATVRPADPPAAPPAPGTDMTRGIPIADTTVPPPIVNPDNSDIKRVRNYSMQPPVIPHKVEGYQLDKSANRCMFCHARTRTQESQAPMISVTHFEDRSGNHLAELSPRRYFCMTCHVPQADLKPLVENRFVDVDSMLHGQATAGAASAAGPASAASPASR